MLRQTVAQEPTQTVAQLSKQIDTQLEEMKKRGASASAESLPEELEQLQQQSVMVFGEGRRRLEEKLPQFQRKIDEWKAAVAVNPAESRKMLAQARQLWAEIKSQYPEEALQVLPPLWSCSMHQQLMQAGPGNCSICGMALEPVYVTQPQLTQGPIIRAEIISKAPLRVGEQADLRIRLLFNSDGRPVRLDDLEETHTRKIHLLISDVSETDYHHEHPQLVADGEYAFSFTPNRPDTYRVWADLKPALTHIQQYSVADIPSNTPRQGRPPGNEPENRHAEIDGYKFDLAFDKPIIQEKETVPGKLTVTGPDGAPFDKLEVVMGAFGHLVGFSDDFSTVLHIHPAGSSIEATDALGGPELPFYFRASKPGVIRFFAQVRIHGKEIFPRFVIRVQPLQHLPSL